MDRATLTAQYLNEVKCSGVAARDLVGAQPESELMNAFYSGRYLSHPKVELLRSSSVAVHADEPLPLEVDGEPIGTTPARFEIVPSALRVRVPAA